MHLTSHLGRLLMKIVATFVKGSSLVLINETSNSSKLFASKTNWPLKRDVWAVLLVLLQVALLGVSPSASIKPKLESHGKKVWLILFDFITGDLVGKACAVWGVQSGLTLTSYITSPGSVPKMRACDLVMNMVVVLGWWSQRPSPTLNIPRSPFVSSKSCSGAGTSTLSTSEN